MSIAYYSLDSALVDTDKNNYPVRVEIESSSGFLSGLDSEAWKYLHATVDDEECYVEIEKWDIVAEEAILWVKIPIISSTENTVIKIAVTSILNSTYGETFSYSTNTLNITNQALHGMDFNADGSAVIIGGVYSDLIYQWDLSSNWVLPSGSPDHYYSEPIQNNISSVKFANNGQYLYISGVETDRIQRYYLSTPYDISTKVLEQNVVVSDGTGNINFSADGLYMSRKSEIYSMSVAWDLTTLTFIGDVLTTTNNGIMTPDGKHFYKITYDTPNYISRYDLATAWDYTSVGNEIVLFSLPTSTNTYGIYIREHDGIVDIYISESAYQSTHNIYLYNDIPLSHVNLIDNQEAEYVWSNFEGVYHFSELPTGTDSILDSSTNNFALTSVQMDSNNSVDTSVGKGISFNGSNEYIAHSSVVQYGSNSTTTLKFSITSLPSPDSHYTLLHQGNTTVSDEQGMMIILTETGNIGLWYYETTYRYVYSTNSCVVGDNIITISFDNVEGTITFVINGVSETSPTFYAYDNISTQPLYVGVTRGASLTSYFNGVIDELFILNEATVVNYGELMYAILGGVALTYSATDPNSVTSRDFITNQEIIFDTLSNISVVRYFLNTNQNIKFSTGESDLHLTYLFSSQQNIKINTSDTEFKTIGTSNLPVGPKKLQYMIDAMISDSIESDYPLYKEFIYSFLKYLDLTSIKTTLNILNNASVLTVYQEFLDSYMNQYFKDVIDLSKYGLTDDNKRRFLQQSRLILNLKGNKKVFDFLFKSLTNIRIANDDYQIEVDKIAIEYLEDESWSEPPIINYYDGLIYYNGDNNHSVKTSRPFTYRFKIDQSRETMLPLIRSSHPAGFDYEFLMEAIFTDNVSMVDELFTNTRYYHFYSGYAVGKTTYYYDGSIKYTPYHDVTLTV